jgi:thiamine pyrophosphokinase
MATTTALVVCGGGPVRVAIQAPPDAFVIAADAGATEAGRLGFGIDLLIGDLDSVPPDVLEAARRVGTRVQRHPADKDATDLELALEAALAAGVTKILVAGGDGGRLDHVLGNALLLASPRWAAVQVDAVFGSATAHVIRGTRTLGPTVDETISLFAAGGIARGVTTQGLRWTLADDDLLPGSSRGISNVVVSTPVSIEVREGTLVAVRPGGEHP